MKKFVPVLIVLVLVVSIIGIAKGFPVWASPKQAAGSNAPLRTLIDVTANGTYNVGGVCNITANFITTGNDIKADSEVPFEQPKVVPFGGEGDLLYPGCHFVFSKGGTVVNQMNVTDATLKVCFGASPELQMGIYYYLDNAGSGGRVWAPLPSTLEDNGRLICAPAQYTGVYMPTGKVVPPPGSEKPGANPFFPEGSGGTVLPPPSQVSFNASGTYAVGGICLITARYDVTGLSDAAKVVFPSVGEYSKDTKTSPFDTFYVNGDEFFFPGCHVRDQVIQDAMNKGGADDGAWQICFAAIPGKTMTIYYYADDSVHPVITPTNWQSLTTTTANGMACAGLANVSAVYAPAGK